MTPNSPALAWNREDFEQRLFFPGGKYTRVNSILTALLGFLLTALFYGVMYLLLRNPSGNRFATLFLEQGPIPYFIVFFTAWSIAILFVKSRKLKYQKKALTYRVVPKDSDFILSARNADTVVDLMYDTADDPKKFLLFNRIEVAVSNLKNLGQVRDVGDILINQADQDEAILETSYGLLKGFIWAIPVLGFIGTVLGLSSAIGGFGAVLESASDIEQIKSELVSVTSGLSMAFVTTLQALVAALCLQLVMTFLKTSEEQFLEESSEYCTKHIVNRLRTMPFKEQRDN